MPSYADNLTTRRDRVAARLAALTEGAVGDKPNTAGGSGAQVDHVGYRESLLQELEELNTLLNQAAENVQQDELIANGPWEVRA